LTDTKNDLEKGLRRTQDIINLTTNIRWKVMKGHRVYWILVDDNSLVNFLSVEAMIKMGIDTSKMTLVPTPLIGIEGSVLPVRGQQG
jgi:hypothetical protein